MLSLVLKFAGLAWKYRRAVLAATVAASIAGWGSYHVGHTVGFSDGRKAAVAASTEATLPIKEKQDEVRNYRPDTATLFDRMLRGHF